MTRPAVHRDLSTGPAGGRRQGAPGPGSETDPAMGGQALASPTDAQMVQLKGGMPAIWCGSNRHEPGSAGKALCGDEKRILEIESQSEVVSPTRSSSTSGSSGGRGRSSRNTAFVESGCSVWTGPGLGLMRARSQLGGQSPPSTIIADSCGCDLEPMVQTRGPTYPSDVGLTEFSACD